METAGFSDFTYQELDRWWRLQHIGERVLEASEIRTVSRVVDLFDALCEGEWIGEQDYQTVFDGIALFAAPGLLTKCEFDNIKELQGGIR